MMTDRGALGRFGVQREVPISTRQRRALIPRLFELLARRLASRAMGLLSEGQVRRIQQRLDSAGRPGGMTVETYAGRKAAFTVLFSLAGLLFLVDGNVLLAVVLAGLGWVWIDMWLGQAGRRRQERIDRDLPDFLDILSVTVSAGVGFRPALTRVAEALGGPLGEEVLTGLRQMDLGVSRRDAFTALRRRNDSQALGQFVTALLQAEELGVPLAQALANLATDMRRDFYQLARRRAARAAPRVSLIVSIVVVPGAVLLIIGALFIGSGSNVGGVFGG
jgi:tight adherence protein C